MINRALPETTSIAFGSDMRRLTPPHCRGCYCI